jgi:Ammonium Transporter Family
VAFQTPARRRLGFNVAPSFLRGSHKMDVASRAMVNTTLAACAGGLTGLFACAAHHHCSQSGKPVWDLHATYNGIMSGVVVVTPISPYIDGWCTFSLSTPSHPSPLRSAPTLMNGATPFFTPCHPSALLSAITLIADATPFSQQLLTPLCCFLPLHRWMVQPLSLQQLLTPLCSYQPLH